METETLNSMQDNFRTLREMWTSKVQEEQKLLKSKPPTRRVQSQLVQKPLVTVELPSSLSLSETIINKPSAVTLTEQEPLEFKPIDETPSIDDSDVFFPLPPPPPLPVVFRDQVQSVVTLKQSVAKLFDFDKKKPSFPNVKNSGIRHWHLARHVFRSGLVFTPLRRASDSIVPLLIKTHTAQHRPRSDSLDSVLTPTPLEGLIDYLASSNNDASADETQKKVLIKRTISDATACIERNKLNDTIAQYETLMRRLKNYDKFMSTYPAPVAAVTPPRQSSLNMEQIASQSEENVLSFDAAKSSSRSRQTQSLARNAGRTFTDFIMGDFLLSPMSKTTSTEPRALSTIHAASQTDLAEAVSSADSVPKEEKEEEEEEERATEEALHELDAALATTEERVEAPLTANAEVNVIVVNPPTVQKEPTPEKDKPLIQRLFEEKKTAYTPSALQMQTSRLPDEMKDVFEVAKKKCFFATEQVTYVTKMVKIDRRGYKQRIRILCITSERVYNITKKDPYPKEAVLFKDILGVSCTPRKDGFICLHTRETREDRGDWIFIVDHPCEFITQLFMTMGRENNHDNYLKIAAKFHHTRRALATVADDSTIEARESDTFRIAFENYEVLAIYSP